MFTLAKPVVTLHQASSALVPVMAMFCLLGVGGWKEKTHNQTNSLK